MFLTDDFCRDICPYGNKELHPDTNNCKVLDNLSPKEDCPVYLFARYASSKLSSPSGSVNLYPQKIVR